MSWDNIETNKQKKEQQKGPDNLQKEVSFISMKLASVNWNPQIPTLCILIVIKSCSQTLRKFSSSSFLSTESWQDILSYILATMAGSLIVSDKRCHMDDAYWEVML